MLQRISDGFVSALYLSSFLLLALAMTPIALLAMPPPAEGGPVLVVASPWGAPVQQLIQNARGRPIGPIGTEFAWLASSDTPGFQQQLKLQGALFILNGETLSAICGGEQ